MSTTGRKILKEMGLESVEAGPDHPIYRRGWIVDSQNTTKSQQNAKAAP